MDTETSNAWVETEPLVTLEPAPSLQVVLTVLAELSVAQTVAGSSVRALNPAYKFCSWVMFQG